MYMYILDCSFQFFSSLCLLRELVFKLDLGNAELVNFTVRAFLHLEIQA